MSFTTLELVTLHRLVIEAKRKAEYNAILNRDNEDELDLTAFYRTLAQKIRALEEDTTQ